MTNTELYINKTVQLELFQLRTEIFENTNFFMLNRKWLIILYTKVISMNDNICFFGELAKVTSSASSPM